MFGLADVCGVRPSEIDALPFLEFLILCDGVQNRWDHRKVAWEKHGIWIA